MWLLGWLRSRMGKTATQSRQHCHQWWVNALVISSLLFWLPLKRNDFTMPWALPSLVKRFLELQRISWFLSIVSSYPLSFLFPKLCSPPNPRLFVHACFKTICWKQENKFELKKKKNPKVTKQSKDIQTANGQEGRDIGDWGWGAGEGLWVRWGIRSMGTSFSTSSPGLGESPNIISPEKGDVRTLP